MRKQFCVVRAYRPRQMCGRPPSLWTLWTLVSRPAAREEEGRKGWRWLTRAVDGWRVGGGRGGSSLDFHPSLSFSKPIHTHTHFSSSSRSSSGTVTCTPYPQKLIATVSAINRSQVSTIRDCSLSISCTCHLITLVSLPHPLPLKRSIGPWCAFSDGLVSHIL